MPFGFPSKPSPSAPWARGLLSAFWERGSPDLLTCGPRHGSTSGPVRPIFTSKHSRPSQGAEPGDANDAIPPRGQLHQVGSRGAERSWQGPPRKVSVTQAMMSGAKQAPGGRQRAQCPRFLFGAKEASAGEEYRGIKQRFPYRCNETKTSRTAGQRSPWSPRWRHHLSVWQAKTTLVRITCTSCLPSNLAIVASLPASIWEEDQGLYK